MNSKYKKNTYNVFDHNDYAKKKPKTDFWGQIKRTVNGKPVSKKQIRLIINEISKRLKLSRNDHLLDLGCGNGALTFLLKNKVKKITAVDFSTYLIMVAKNKFRANNIYYYKSDMFDFIKKTNSDKYNKVLIYGSFSYLSNFKSKLILKSLSNKFKNLKIVFIGNLPDLNKKKKFFDYNIPTLKKLKNHKTAIGIWRTKKEISKICRFKNFKFKITKMKKEFYSSNYRYDLTIHKSI